jgi:hypothetical protein
VCATVVTGNHLAKDIA